MSPVDPVYSPLARIVSDLPDPDIEIPERSPTPIHLTLRSKKRRHSSFVKKENLKEAETKKTHSENEESNDDGSSGIEMEPANIKRAKRAYQSVQITVPIGVAISEPKTIVHAYLSASSRLLFYSARVKRKGQMDFDKEKITFEQIKFSAEYKKGSKRRTMEAIKHDIVRIRDAKEGPPRLATSNATQKSDNSILPPVPLPESDGTPEKESSDVSVDLSTLGNVAIHSEDIRKEKQSTNKGNPSIPGVKAFSSQSSCPPFRIVERVMEHHAALKDELEQLPVVMREYVAKKDVIIKDLKLQLDQVKESELSANKEIQSMTKEDSTNTSTVLAHSFTPKPQTAKEIIDIFLYSKFPEDHVNEDMFYELTARRTIHAGRAFDEINILDPIHDISIKGRAEGIEILEDCAYRKYVDIDGAVKLVWLAGDHVVVSDERGNRYLKNVILKEVKPTAAFDF